MTCQAPGAIFVHYYPTIKHTALTYALGPREHRVVAKAQLCWAARWNSKKEEGREGGFPGVWACPEVPNGLPNSSSTD
jgi:hypothetical protein